MICRTIQPVAAPINALGARSAQRERGSAGGGTYSPESPKMGSRAVSPGMVTCLGDHAHNVAAYFSSQTRKVQANDAGRDGLSSSSVASPKPEKRQTRRPQVNGEVMSPLDIACYLSEKWA